MIHRFGQAGTFLHRTELLHGIYEEDILSLEKQPPSRSEWWVIGRKRPVKSTDSSFCPLQSVDHRIPTTIAQAEYCQPPFRINRKACLCRVASYLLQFYLYNGAVTTTGVVGPSERTTAPSHHREVRTNPSCVIPRDFCVNVEVVPDYNTSHIYDGRIIPSGGERHRRRDKKGKVHWQHVTCRRSAEVTW
jgi:hypothetical protein